MPAFARKKNVSTNVWARSVREKIEKRVSTDKLSMETPDEREGDVYLQCLSVVQKYLQNKQEK